MPLQKVASSINNSRLLSTTVLMQLRSVNNVLVAATHHAKTPRTEMPKARLGTAACNQDAEVGIHFARQLDSSQAMGDSTSSLNMDKLLNRPLTGLVRLQRSMRLATIKNATSTTECESLARTKTQMKFTFLVSSSYAWRCIAILKSLILCPRINSANYFDVFPRMNFAALRSQNQNGSADFHQRSFHSSCGNAHHKRCGTS